MQSTESTAWSALATKTEHEPHLVLPQIESHRS